ncbi:hypothetical protein [Luteibacter jiangsuensis]
MSLVLAEDPADSLRARVERLSKPPLQLTPLNRSVHFLRGVYSRATFASASFYAFVGASGEDEGTPAVADFPGVVFHNFLEHTAFASLTLDCRKAFGESIKGLTGGFFGKVSDELLVEHAAFWAKRASAPPADALAALRFLRMLFRRLSKHRAELLRGPSELEQRIGLIKFHADRAAAHLSLDDYAIDVLDMAHFAAALVIIGEIIRAFDAPWDSSTRFNDLDAAAATAAHKLFPNSRSLPMLGTMDVSLRARLCWKDPKVGLDYITRQLPKSTGWE